MNFIRSRLPSDLFKMIEYNMSRKGVNKYMKTDKLSYKWHQHYGLLAKFDCKPYTSTDFISVLSSSRKEFKLGIGDSEFLKTLNEGKKNSQIEVKYSDDILNLLSIYSMKFGGSEPEDDFLGDLGDMEFENNLKPKMHKIYAKNLLCAELQEINGLGCEQGIIINRRRHEIWDDHENRSNEKLILVWGSEEESNFAEKLMSGAMDKWKIFDLLEASNYFDMTRLRELLLTHLSWKIVLHESENQ